MNRREAERRARQIHAFRAELALLEKGGVLKLAEGEAARVAAYHGALLAGFSKDFDADLDAGAARLSWGMRIVSTLGAAALSLGIFLFFNHYWDDLSTALQVALAVLAPLLGVAATEWIAARFQTRHFTELAALVTIACFILNLCLLGEIFNLTPSPGAFFVWGAFAVLMAARHSLGLSLGIGLTGLAVFMGAMLTQFAGYYWLHEIITELYLAPFLLILLAPLLRIQYIQDNRFIFFYTGLLGVFLQLLGIVTLGPESLLPFSSDGVGWTYLIAAVVFGAGALGWSVRQGWEGGAYLSAGFLILLLGIKYFDWFWDKWPAYIFFLILGLLAVGVILLLRKLRLTGRRVHDAP
ncbi:DUF2157 domain-containing protein [Sneathiella sp.]|uniref:DUF2157 domain-containing protein n=1 Tax=Sneathiella sp. TaxID=1964365 RepID=UPI002FE40871